MSVDNKTWNQMAPGSNYLQIMMKDILLKHTYDKNVSDRPPILWCNKSSLLGQIIIIRFLGLLRKLS